METAMETATKSQVIATFTKMASELSTERLQEWIENVSGLVDDASASDAPVELVKNYSTAWFCLNRELKQRMGAQYSPA